MPRHLVAHRNDLNDGDLKAVQAGDFDLVLVATRGHVHAYPARCPHAGGPLAEGLLSGDRLMCPWHHACFAAHTGDLLEPPAQDALTRFEVMAEGDNLYAVLPDDPPESRVPETTPPDSADERVFAVVGAGAAGSAAAEALRQEGFTGRVVLITEDAEPPYDRTVLSKEYLGEPSEPALRDRAFYEAHGLELHLNRTVARVSPAERSLTFADGERLRYDALLLATGSRPVPLDVPRTRLGGIFYLRTLSDAERIAGTAADTAGDGGRAVVVGGSFIGMECAASLRKKGLDVTVVMPGAVPFAKLLGPEVGGMFRAFHEEQGVTFVTDTKVAEFGGDGRVSSVTLEDGQTLPADLVVIGTGVKPALPELVGVAPQDDGGVSVDGTLKLEGERGPVYAVGDLAHFPDPYSGESVRVEHWRVALQHGRAAARAMLGKSEVFGGVPFFWTKQFGVSFRYVGHAPGWDACVIDGDLAGRRFLAYYLKENRVAAVFGVGRDPDLCAVEEAMRLAVTPTAAEVRRGPVDWAARLGTA